MTEMKELTLTDDQLSVSNMFTQFLLNKEKFMIVQGSSGTGKSTLIKYLLANVQNRMKMYAVLLGGGKEREFKLKLTATTNQAVIILNALAGSTEGTTIHSLLGLVPKKNFKTGKIDFIRGRNSQVLHNCLLVIDEASCIDNDLLKLIDELTVSCKILLVGDQWQTAPINQTNPVLDDMVCAKGNLDQVMRHCGAIAEAGAHYRESIKTGIFHDLVPNGVDVIHAPGPLFREMFEAEFTSPDYEPSNVRILVYKNKLAQAYNQHIRAMLGMSPEIGVGDLVTTNNPIVVGGAKSECLYSTDSIVNITSVDERDVQHGIAGNMVTLNHRHEFFLPHDQLEVAALIAKLRKAKKWPTFFEIKDAWLDLRPMYASTVHKSQGSTYDKVFINLPNIGECFSYTDVGRMLYVAITRAAKQVILYGELPYKYRGGYVHTPKKEKICT